MAHVVHAVAQCVYKYAHRCEMCSRSASPFSRTAHGTWAALRAGRCALGAARVPESATVRPVSGVCGVSAPEDRGLWCAVCVAAPVLAQLLRYEDDLALEQYPFRKK